MSPAKEPTRSLFQGGPIRKTIKALALVGFAYGVFEVMALGHKEKGPVLVEVISLVVLLTIFLAESFRYWSDMKKWSVERRAKREQE